MRCGCRAEVVNGEVQVVGPSSASQDPAAEPGAKNAAGNEDFEVPSQLRQQFIEVRLHTHPWTISPSHAPTLHCTSAAKPCGHAKENYQSCPTYHEPKAIGIASLHPSLCSLHGFTAQLNICPGPKFRTGRTSPAILGVAMQAFVLRNGLGLLLCVSWLG